jgi:hypothetical protein
MSNDMHFPQVNRRDALKAAGLGAAVLAVGGLSIPAAAAYVHPGMLSTAADFTRMSAKIAANASPWVAGYAKLTSNSHASSSWVANPQATIDRGSGTAENYGIAYNDIAAAYQNALRWKITGTAAYGNAACDILNAWSAKLTSITGNADRFLAAGIYGYEFANAGELMRGYSGFNLTAFKDMMLNVFYPVNNDFLVNHNNAYVTNYWANWDLCNMASILAIGILCDDSAKVNQSVDYFKTGVGMGSIMNAIPYVYDSQGLAQWQESCRDQGHTMLGVGLLGTICEMAWHQGIDLYGYDSNRFMKACEYVAKYNLGHDVPFTDYTWVSGSLSGSKTTRTFTSISSASRGQLRPTWAGLYAHYGVRKGLSVPYTLAYKNLCQPEGGGGDYGTTSGGFDHLGFGTLTSTL